MKWFSQSDAPDDLDRVLFNLTPKDPITVRQAVEGIMVFGSTGSGKSSASIKTIVKAYLENGCGGLILTVKPDDCETYERWISEAGRSADKIIFAADRPERFNFMDYEAQRPGEGAGLNRNLVTLFNTVLEMSGGHTKGGGEDSYWHNSAEQLLSRLIDLALLARGKASVQLLYELLTTAAQSAEEFRSPEWQSKSEMFKCLFEAGRRKKAGELTEIQAHDLEVITRYFTAEWSTLAERPRSIITNMVTSMMSRFLIGHLRELFCTSTTITPEMIWEENRIVICDFPLKNWRELGKIAQGIIKKAFQDAVERRNVEQYGQPVFLLIDEAQNFLTSQDFMWLTTARSSRTMTLLATQSYSNLLAVLGGQSSAKAKAEADALMTNLNTKIFHANSDPATNLFASDLIGRVWQSRVSVGRSRTADGLGTTSTQVNETLTHLVEPYQFTLLKKGGAPNRNEVTGIAQQSGRIFSNGETFISVTFKQD